MAETFEDEAEQTVTINEYIEGLEAEELEADLVLGGDEGKECTYPNGYMKRQAIFSCLTCVPSGNAGVCTACSLSCHDGHEVVELWTKRKFRCDCGNSKFGEFFCKLSANKDPENPKNLYNHNFKGSYCTCCCPYPDPDAAEQVEMIQCCICEDWFHENHLGLGSSEEIPRDDEGEPLYDEFICQDCSLICSFLKLFPASIRLSSKQISEPVSIKEKGILENGPAASASLVEIENGVNASGIHEPGSLSIVYDPDLCTINRELNSECVLGMDLNAIPLGLEKKSMFLSRKWRDVLCRCRACSDFYTKKGINFLTDKEDSIEEYEKMANQKREEKLQKQEGDELNFLNTMNHVQKIEILNGIADMKNELQSFLGSVDSSKPITSADVHEVFENLAKKRQRLL